MVTIKDGDLFGAKGLICHQVNCKGTMERGLAKTFKLIFPVAYKNYLDLCKEEQGHSSELLGGVAFSMEETGHTCCMFAQDDWRGNGCKTNYDAFRKCCKLITEHIDSFFYNNYAINMPFGIGCGLGGGDWLVVKAILDEEFKDYNLILWKLK